MESSDGLTDALDGAKGYHPKPMMKIYASYWDEWRAKQQNIQEKTDDLFLKFLLGQGDRPDIGAGITEISSADLAKKENRRIKTNATL